MNTPSASVVCTDDEAASRGTVSTAKRDQERVELGRGSTAARRTTTRPKLRKPVHADR